MSDEHRTSKEQFAELLDEMTSPQQIRPVRRLGEKLRKILADYEIPEEMAEAFGALQRKVFEQHEEIERLRRENAELRHDIERAVAANSTALPEPPSTESAAALAQCPFCGSPRDDRGGINHASGCEGLKPAGLNKLQEYMMLENSADQIAKLTTERNVARAALPPSEQLQQAHRACWAMAEDGWLMHGVEGMDETQQLLCDYTHKYPKDCTAVTKSEMSTEEFLGFISSKPVETSAAQAKSEHETPVCSWCLQGVTVDHNGNHWPHGRMSDWYPCTARASRTAPETWREPDSK